MARHKFTIARRHCAGARRGSCAGVLGLSLALLGPASALLPTTPKLLQVPAIAVSNVRAASQRHLHQSMSTPFTPPHALKGLFVGSGSDGLNDVSVCNTILSLTGKSSANVKVLYLGTATYDLVGPRERYQLSAVPTVSR